MITVSKGDFQQNVQAYLRQVEETGEEIVVTSNKIPVLKIISIKNADDVFTDVQGKVKHHGDMLEQKKEEWEEF